ncbi:MAG: B12 binding domain protein [Candidatus Argoarchaeum ethanivorans]|uniref:B12 binding domain protein n=1 Tax=Candidatus Argoarchaeum ethanivorans TaxID=2608793 RepID=A0A811T497_9EURY|nr:MAG: B12 binding domain protein [Candidatus Argoarchaeum ethanivorans]
MKTLLINPPQTFFPGSQPVVAGLPLGIMYIAATLENNGYDVEILDTLIADFKPRKKGDVKYCGMPWKNIKEEIKQSKPDIVSITNPFTAQIDNAIKVSEIVKEIDNEILTVVGGPHVSVRATQFLKDAKNVDIAVIGEGEYTMLDIMKYYEGKQNISKIQGIAYRKGDTVTLNPLRPFIKNLDALPFPAYHLVDMEQYLNPKRIRYRATKYLREISMITSRGCPFNCIFCSIHLHMGKAWRAHSKEYVLRHMEHVVNNYGVEHIHFEDDNFTLNIKRFDGILDGITEKGIKFSWDTPNGIRADKLTIDILKKMKKTGCTNLTIAVESGDQFILDNVIDKHLRLEDVIKMVKMCKELHIPISAFYVIGFPGEKKENMKRTTEFALMLKKRYNVNMSLLIATPLYGTRLYEFCKEEGYLTQELTPRAISEGTQADGVGLIKTEDFTPEEVKSLALGAVTIQSKFLLVEHIKHPMSTVKKVLRNPAAGVQFIKRVIGI